MQIGAQLYTVRDYMKDTDALAETLKKIADIGYRTVQVSAACPYDPAWMRDRLAENGLACVLTHTACDRLLAEPATVAAEHAVFGCKYIGIGWYDIAREGLDDFVARFAPVGRTLYERGAQLMYHNHDMEFVRFGDSVLLQQLAERFAPEELGITLDTYWVQYGGGDPSDWLRRLRGRTPCIHLKDMGHGHTMQPVGSGNMNFDGILAAAEETGVQYALVEQDDCNGEDPFACLARSFAYLHACGLC